jgi:hypothetical protein
LPAQTLERLEPVQASELAPELEYRMSEAEQPEQVLVPVPPERAPVLVPLPSSERFRCGAYRAPLA